MEPASSLPAGTQSPKTISSNGKATIGPSLSSPAGAASGLTQSPRNSASKKLAVSNSAEWSTRDDLILLKSMEAGYSLEALARGAMDFSRRFTLQQLQERWRALLYDPGVAIEASRRMLAVCGQAAVLGDLSAVPSFPSVEARKKESPREQEGLRSMYSRARKRARKEAQERRKRLLLDPTFADLYADDDDMSVGLADPGMPTPQDMNSLNGLEEPLLANLEAFEERIRGGGRSRHARGWEADIEDEQVTRMRKRKEVLGYRQAQAAKGGDAKAEPTSTGWGGATEQAGGTYDLLVVNHEGEGGGQDDGWANGQSVLWEHKEEKDGVSGKGLKRSHSVEEQAWTQAGAALMVPETVLVDGAAGGIEHDMFHEMFSVLTGDMGGKDAVDAVGMQLDSLKPEPEVAGHAAQTGASAQASIKKEEGVESAGEPEVAGVDGLSALPEEQSPAVPDVKMEETVPSGKNETASDHEEKIGLPFVELAPMSVERVSPELSFGMSESRADKDHAAEALPSPTSKREDSPAVKQEEQEATEGKTETCEQPGSQQQDVELCAKEETNQVTSETGPKTENGAGPAPLPGDFRLAPAAKPQSPWNTPRLGPQAAPPDPDLLPNLDGLAPWSPPGKKKLGPAPSPLFNFVKGPGPSPTFTPLPGADATEELDFLPLPTAALTSAPGSILLSVGGASRPSSSPSLAPYPRAAFPRLADQLQLMEEDTRSEPGDIGRFRQKQLQRASSLDPGAAERPLLGGTAQHTRGGEATREEEEAQEHKEERGEEGGWNSEDEQLYFSDVEAVILDMDLEPDDETGDAARKQARRLQKKYRKTILRLEQMADAATCRQLTKERALAVLYGRRLRYLIRDSEILLGRSTVEHPVDVDLSAEGAANRVSRKQASIKLKKDGHWYIKNLGKRELQVNNRPVEAGSREKLENKCLLEIGGLRFVFEINSKLVAKVLSRMPADR